MSRVVLFVGSNPSISAKTAQSFCLSTVSGRTLKKWIDQIGVIINCYATNVSSTPKINNKPLSMKEIKDSIRFLIHNINYLEPDCIVALGKTAEKALTLLGVDHYAMPHPSGLNRKLNDKQYMQEKIKGLAEYITSPSK